MRATEIIFASALATASAVALGCNRDANRTDDKTVAGEDEEGGRAAGPLSESTREFILAAATDGLLEMEAAKLAESRAQTEPVRQFARMMAEHHARANEELAALARRKNVEVPKALDEKAQDRLDGLRDETGRDFDEEYLDFMIDEHQRVIREFERQAEREGEDPDVKGWASQTLPTLRTHLDQAKRTEDSIDESPFGGLGNIGADRGAQDVASPGSQGQTKTDFTPPPAGGAR
jgi:putative membrane protein